MDEAAAGGRAGNDGAAGPAGVPAPGVTAGASGGFIGLLAFVAAAAGAGGAFAGLPALVRAEVGPPCPSTFLRGTAVPDVDAGLGATDFTDSVGGDCTAGVGQARTSRVSNAQVIATSESTVVARVALRIVLRNFMGVARMAVFP